jgi:DMSO/TMAO reductase YedYZ heme-binding membrane subunit
MITLPLILVLFLLARRYGRHFHKIRFYLYGAGLLLSFLAFLWLDHPLFTMFRQGYLGLAFLYVVMIAGALPQPKNRQSPIEQENPVRRDYAILAFLTFTPHVLFYLQDASGTPIARPLFGILSYAVMFPLFLTSFSHIRRRFRYPTWKTIQRAAYVAYVLLFVHLIVQSDGANRMVYLILLVVYVVLKSIHTIRGVRAKED